MRIRKQAVAGVAAVVAALAVAGCSGDGGGGKDKTSDGGSSSSAAPDGGSPSGTPTGSSGSAGNIEGIWSATTGGQAVVLVVGGKQASLSTGDGHLCTGTVTSGGKPTLTLKCADGNNDRTTGSVESHDGTTMKVSWDAGADDTFTRSTDGKLPSGLPTGLPSGLPTG
ncbi:hypothetical protein ACIRF8_30630 [Streptomyces sp. NPDC102406]|uniref:hypothetical protein n=1 Tax=Streptomyces sp. NPDC102406 TaxID=3366171 RepID=UPI00381BBFDA